ncbi:hypothetical protein [Enterovibrio coralii]|uniref:Uncharacterized protein n=1 Tax=Enterovibrio coralii TaxID=294935 RepID=A0A135IC23_9GAMM|nr:hypothetical protein [Enterovibrio coralii]KXF83021.1 hypothetical protein ATN88_04600 [Enterovibrio coralii]
MSRLLSQFIRRNATGQQSLKPIVGSYYSGVSSSSLAYESHQPPKTKSDSVTNDAGDSLSFSPNDEPKNTFPNQTMSKTAFESELPLPTTTRLDQSSINIDIDSERETSKPSSISDDFLGDKLFNKPHQTSIQYRERQRDEQGTHGDQAQQKGLLQSHEEKDGEREEHYRGIEALHDKNTLSHSNIEEQRQLKHRQRQKHTAEDTSFVQHDDSLRRHMSVEDEQETVSTSHARRRDFTKAVAAAILGENSQNAENRSLNINANLEGHTPRGESPSNLAPELLEVSVTIANVSIVSTERSQESSTPSWKPPISLNDYLRARKEGKR